MTAYCIFRLYGPMASWGDIAVGEERHTWDHPSRSAIFGMVAAALGIRRGEEEVHRQLTSSYGFSVMVDSPGVPVIDYHTIQTPPQSQISRGNHFRTRRDELSIPRHTLSTIISRRDYLCDMIATVCLWPRVDDPIHTPEEIAAALREPTFELFLGRKSCPLSLPVKAQVVDASSVMEAFQRAAFDDGEFTQSLLRGQERVGLYWDGDTDAGVPSSQIAPRRDMVVSRRRWLFGNRQERFAMVPPPQRGDV